MAEWMLDECFKVEEGEGLLAGLTGVHSKIDA